MKHFIRTLKIFKIIIIGLIMNSCCNETDENYGIIQSDLNIDGFYIITYDCLNLPDTACIRNESQYNEIFEITGTDSDCGQIKMPEVDFTKYSILINYKDQGGKIFYHRSVTVDSTNKIISYMISTVSCPTVVNSRTESYNLILVPRIGNDYKVDYK